jgi:23S rRNA (uracil1939-C5)-methyltransferase
MEFSFYQNSHGERHLGLMKVGSRRNVIDIVDCMISSSHVASILAAVKHWWEKSGLNAYHASQDRFALRTFTLREGKNTKELMGVLTVSGNPEYAPKKSQLVEFQTLLTEAAKPLPISVYLRIQQMIKGMPTQFYEWHLAGPTTLKERLDIELPNGEKKSLFFQISPSTFFQPNTHMASKLYAKALEMAQVNKEDHVLDLYCGIGGMGICFSFLCKNVLGVELNPYAVLDGRECLKANGISNMEIVQSDVENMLRHMRFRPDIVVIDPPRAGMGEKSSTLLAQFQSKKIIYISCNPKTQAEDIKTLCKFGYVVKALQPVDQFPHTPHLETIAFIEKS